jgi:hypothetical protein
MELMTELRGLLKHLHPDDPNPKFSWIRVVIIINYETNGHPEGLALATAWSNRGTSHNDPAGVRKFWKNIKPVPGNPLTIRSLHWMLEKKGAQ